MDSESKVRRALQGEGREMVPADEWDALCDVAQQLANALRPFARGHRCECESESEIDCCWCRARRALRDFEDGDR